MPTWLCEIMCTAPTVEEGIQFVKDVEVCPVKQFPNPPAKPLSWDFVTATALTLWAWQVRPEIDL